MTELVGLPAGFLIFFRPGDMKTSLADHLCNCTLPELLWLAALAYVKHN